MLRRSTVPRHWQWRWSRLCGRATAVARPGLRLLRPRAPRGPRRAQPLSHVWPTSPSASKLGHGRLKGPWLGFRVFEVVVATTSRAAATLRHAALPGSGAVRANWAARIPGTRGRWRGRTGSFEQHTPCRAIAPALVLQGSACVRCFCKAARAISGFGLEEAHISDHKWPRLRAGVR